MKNMRSFSMVTLSILVLLSNAPVVAFGEDPGMEFPGNQSAENREFIAESFAAAKTIYKENAPRVEAFGKTALEAVKTECKNAKDGFTHLYNNVFDNNPVAVTAAPVVEIVVPSSPANATVAPAPSFPVKAGFSMKNFFSQATEAVKSRGSQLKEAAKAHPVITTAVVAAIIAAPLAVYGWKKARKSTGAQKAAAYLPSAAVVKTTAIVGAMVASVAVPMAIAVYNNDANVAGLQE